MNTDGTIVAASPEVELDDRYTGKFTGYTGLYSIAFNRSVDSCAWVAAVWDDQAPFTGKGFATPFKLGFNQLGVSVSSTAGAEMDAPFSLIVAC